MKGELRLTLMGRPRVVCDDTLLTGWILHKSLALLAYLAVTGRPHSRRALAGLLWPECTEAGALSNLRKVLAELRLRIPAHVMITRSEVAFDRESDYWLDVDAFEGGVNRALALPGLHLNGTGAVALAEAIELYQDDFLLGLDVHRSPAFEEWVTMEREHLRLQALRALHVLVDYHARRAQPERTLACLDRLLALEPAHEEAHRHKMTLLSCSGQRTAALLQYESCRRALQKLDAEPDVETKALYQRIRSGAEPPAPFRIRGHNLYVPMSPLVGREAELAVIQANLLDPNCRLLTLVGPGGVGKTHLALKAAANLQSDDLLPDGVTIVHLCSIPAVEAILPAIARVLDLPLAEGAHPMQQVVDALSGKQLLLVMDGFEHLQAGAGLLVDLLQKVPGLKVLVTSRVRLDVEGEHLLTIRGLACPDHVPEDAETLVSSPAVRLFLAGARRVQPGFEILCADLAAVVRICHLVAGLPLPILLAASWAGTLSPAEIAAELEMGSGHGLDLLQTDGQDMPTRARSMRAVFDHSWNLLGDRERQVLAGLSVLRGSSTLDAAREVAGASLRELRSLTERSLLERTAAGCYAMHELLRQYAEERLLEVPGAAQEARDRHSAFFSAGMEQWWADLRGVRHQSALARIDAENGNLRAAWDWAVERGQIAQLDRAMDGLCYFYKWLGRYEEGESLCRRAAEGLTATGDLRWEEAPDPFKAPDVSAARQGAETAEWVRVRARALAWQGVFCHRLGRREQAQVLLQQSLDLLDDLASAGPTGVHRPPNEIQRARAFVLWRLGNLTFEQDGEPAQRLYRQSLSLYRALSDDWGIASVLEALGRTATFSEEHDAAQHAYAESLELRQAQGDDLGSYRVLSLSLATAATRGQDGKEGRESQEAASALHEVGLAIGAGQFAKAESLLARRRSRDEATVAGRDADLLDLVRAFNQMHLGRYKRARTLTMACLARFLESGFRWGMERCYCYLALAALAAGDYEEARRRLQESARLCREIREWGHQGQALSLLALVAQGSGDLPQARQYLHEALRLAATIHDYQTFMFRLLVVSAVALLLADEGEVERAVELHAVASRSPLVAHSRLIQDLVGRQMAAVAGELPVEVAAAAQARGRARDLEATIAELSAELGA